MLQKNIDDEELERLRTSSKKSELLTYCTYKVGKGLDADDTAEHRHVGAAMINFRNKYISISQCVSLLQVRLPGKGITHSHVVDAIKNIDSQ